MDKFRLTIELGNDDMCSTGDIAEALRNVSVALEYGQDTGTVRDINGNRVGQWAITGKV